MNKQKIKIGYVLSEQAITNYFLAGNKQEEVQEIEIETSDEYIINQAKLINNEYLEIEWLERKDKNIRMEYYYLDDSRCFGYNESRTDGTIEEIQKEKKLWIGYRDYVYSSSRYVAEKILTEKDVIDFFEIEKNKQKKKDDFFSSIQKEIEKNKNDYEQIQAKYNEKEKLRKEKEYNEKKKLKQLKRSMIDDFVENSGSETLKLRKELGYDYDGLAIQEKCDEIEIQGYEKIEYNKNNIEDWNTISKPRLELLKIIKEIKELDYVMNVDVELWTLEQDYYDMQSPKKIEVLRVEYNIYTENVTRYYIIDS